MLFVLLKKEINDSGLAGSEMFAHACRLNTRSLGKISNLKKTDRTRLSYPSACNNESHYNP